MPNTRWVEYITPSPLVEDILAKPFEIDEDGMTAIPDGPGLGTELNPDGIVTIAVGLHWRRPFVRFAAEGRGPECFKADLPAEGRLRCTTCC